MISEPTANICRKCRQHNGNVKMEKKWGKNGMAKWKKEMVCGGSVTRKAIIKQIFN